LLTARPFSPGKARLAQAGLAGPSEDDGEPLLLKWDPEAGVLRHFSSGRVYRPRSGKTRSEA
jgi:hypothetical protein